MWNWSIIFGREAGIRNETVQAVMNEALKYQGWKYVYGGSNPNTSLIVLVLRSGAMEKLVSSCHEPHRHSMTQPSISHCHRHRLAIWSFSIPPIYAVTMYTHVGIYVRNNQMYHAGNPIGYTDLTSPTGNSTSFVPGRVKQ